MGTIDATTLQPAELAPMLHAWAGGHLPHEAATGLLLAHGHWLGRRDFLARAVDAVDDGWGPRGSIVPMAAVLWDTVPDFAETAPASRSELALLKLAASLAGTATGDSLLDLTSSLDHTNGAHLLDALAHSWGWHVHGVRHLVTGRQNDAAPDPLSPFEELRRHAHRLLADAADALRSPYRPGTGPTGPVADAVRHAFTAIATARNALDDAAHHAAESRARHRAEADSAQYPDHESHR